MKKANRGALSDIEVYAAFNRSFNEAYLNFRISFNDLLDGEGALAKRFMCKHALNHAVWQRHKRANNFVNHRLSYEQYDDLRDAIFAQLYPIMKYGSSKEISFITQSVMQALAKLILGQSIFSFDALISVQFDHLLFSSSVVNARSVFDKNRIQSIVKNVEREGAALAGNYAEQQSLLLKTRFKSSKHHDRDIELEFVTNTVVMK